MSMSSAVPLDARSNWPVMVCQSPHSLLACPEKRLDDNKTQIVKSGHDIQRYAHPEKCYWYLVEYDSFRQARSMLSTLVQFPSSSAFSIWVLLYYGSYYGLMILSRTSRAERSTIIEKRS
ncbi:hypothetical protein AX14_002498 [Amanita brunnescens Koide BX004]|nr:hypothetical protein AX14_002498 [Amanita brunnescens Koide BX004]